MEKNNDCQIKRLTMNINNLFKRNRICQLFRIGVVILLVLPFQAQGQIRAGAGYLKMLHGAREVGTAGTLTGALDHTYSFYANPGATGFMREWHWSATYTNWISDVYNASFVLGKNIRTPWSRWTRVAVGINYLGIPEFNNTNGTTAPVSGNNLLITGSVGQPLSFLTRNLSLGGNVKYFNSTLAGFESKKIIFDLGLLFRTPQLTFLPPENTVFDHLILSTGVSVTNIGSPITFISEETPLPRTLRAGLALNIGAHHGLQISLGTDYRVVRDEAGFFTFTSELSWRQILSFRFGYSLEENLLGNFTFGCGLRFDDLIIQNKLLGKNNALRLDLAMNQSNDFFSAPYHGTFTHQPIGPEFFYLLRPQYNAKFDSNQVTLAWESTQDPDLFDEVSNRLIVDSDSNKIAQLLSLAANDREALFEFLETEQFFVNSPVTQTRQTMHDLPGGDYFWTVLATDKDQHPRFGVMEQRSFSKFHVTAPDPQIVDIQFDYSEWITEDDFQGKLIFSIKNLGDRIAEDFVLSVSDSVINKIDPDVLVYQEIIPAIQPDSVLTIKLDWRTALPGLHQISTKIKLDKKVTNLSQATFYTIPKGTFSIEDSVVVQQQSHVIYDIPYVGKVFFDSSSAVVNGKYIDRWTIEPILALFAKRLKNKPAVKVSLRGTIDPNSDETDINLADRRAKAVKNVLVLLGVNPDQIQLLAGKKIPKRRVPRNNQDARWVFEERRRVDITTDEASEKTLFDPLQAIHRHKKNVPAIFQAKIHGVIPNLSGTLRLQTDKETDSRNLHVKLNGLNVVGNIDWRFDKLSESSREDWLDKQVRYSIVLTDSLKREFRTYPALTYFQSEVLSRERRYYVLAKFGNTQPFYNFYWTGLLDIVPFLLEEENLRMRFEGHGCATGPSAINNRLSKKRAKDFQNKFLKDVRQRYPDLFNEVKRRIDFSQGFGEDVPFEIKSSGGAPLLIGDNRAPLGRQLNRRVMVLISSESKKK